jgi:hypothetical protein
MGVADVGVASVRAHRHFGREPPVWMVAVTSPVVELIIDTVPAK